jgi:hypothetical protein
MQPMRALNDLSISRSAPTSPTLPSPSPSFPFLPLLPVAYWFAAAVPLAHLSQNARLLADLQGFVEHILATQEASGWLGPPNSYTDGNGEWARWPVLAGLLHWREATGDARLLPAVLAHLRESYRRLSTDGPLGGNWAGSRWEDYAYLIEWCLDLVSDDAERTRELTNMLWTVYVPACGRLRPLSHRLLCPH